MWTCLMFINSQVWMHVSMFVGLQSGAKNHDTASEKIWSQPWKSILSTPDHPRKCWVKVGQDFFKNSTLYTDVQAPLKTTLIKFIIKSGLFMIKTLQNICISMAVYA